MSGAEAQGAGPRPGRADPGGARPCPTAVAPALAARAGARAPATGLRTVAIEDVHPSAEQPRKTFDDARLEELAASIRTQGIIQPLIVRARAGGGYELIAGERRWRAAQRAGLHEVPAVMRDVAPRAGVRDGAGREPAARGSEPDRGGGRATSGWSPSSATRRSRWPIGSARSAARSRTRCACCACPTACAGWSRRGGCRWGTRARCSASSRPAAMERLARRTVAPGPVGAQGRGAGPARARRRRRRRREARPATAPVGERARSRPAAVARARHARGRRRGRARAAATSRFTTTRSTSSTRCSIASSRPDD